MPKKGTDSYSEWCRVLEYSLSMGLITPFTQIHKPNLENKIMGKVLFDKDAFWWGLIENVAEYNYLLDKC